MANCKNCAAPLTANTNICEYCGARNDVDLQNTHELRQLCLSQRRSSG